MQKGKKKLKKAIKKENIIGIPLHERKDKTTNKQENKTKKK